MKTLVNGENVILPVTQVITIEAEKLNNLVGVVKGSNNQFNFINNNKINLADLENQRIEEVLFVHIVDNGVTSNFVKLVSSDNTAISINTETEMSGICLIGRLYKHSTGWRYRALRQNFDTYNQVKEELGYIPKLVENQPIVMQQPAVQATQQVVVQNQQNFNSSARLFPQNGLELQKMQSQDLPSDLRNLYLGFSYKSLSTKTGFIQKLVSAQSVDIDMDLSVMLFDRQGNFVETVTALVQRSRDGACYHYGNNGESRGGDSEMISIALASLDPGISFIAVVAGSSKGHKFDLLEHSQLRIKNQEGMIALANQQLSNNEDKPSCILGILCKMNGYWSYQALEQYDKAQNVLDLRSVCQNWVRFVGSSKQIF